MDKSRQILTPVSAAKLPADMIVHPRIVVTRKSGEMILRKIRTAKPTKALRELMRGARRGARP